MLSDHWPLLGLRLRTGRLELRLPQGEELAELADLAAGGVHPPERMPFLVPWTDLGPRARARSVVQHFWRCQGGWAPDDWNLNLVAFENGRPLGLQSVGARDFAVLREVRTGSWVGIGHQGRGVGTGMRAAVLALAFAGLGAEYAVSGAFSDNAASFAVSRKLGYLEDGLHRAVVRGVPVTERRLRLPRAVWEAQPTRAEVVVEGLAPCRELFGLPATEQG